MSNQKLIDLLSLDLWRNTHLKHCKNCESSVTLYCRNSKKEKNYLNNNFSREKFPLQFSDTIVDFCHQKYVVCLLNNYVACLNNNKVAKMLAELLKTLRLLHFFLFLHTNIVSFLFLFASLLIDKG